MFADISDVGGGRGRRQRNAVTQRSTSRGVPAVGLSQKGDSDEAAIQPHEPHASTGRPRMVLEYTNDALCGFATTETVAI